MNGTIDEGYHPVHGFFIRLNHEDGSQFISYMTLSGFERHVKNCQMLIKDCSKDYINDIAKPNNEKP